MSTASTPAAPSWEAHKENAAPLERGRNVASLGLRQSDVNREDLSKRVRHYEELVSPSEDSSVTQMAHDPLSDWLSYIKFYQNSFPSDTRDNFLIIERCVRALAKMKQYSNDDRYISVCAKYADKTKDPGQVFKYLHQQKIGGHVAIFWIAWAFVAEKENDFPFAEQIFKKGISKKAEPRQMLKLRHQQFQRRMSRHWLNSSKTNDQLNDEYDTGEQNRSSRSTLGGISSDRLHRNDRSQQRVRQGGATFRHNNSRRFGANQNSFGNNSTKGSFSIFVEEEGENAYNLDQEYTENDRAVIAREADRRKENLANAERWNERGGIQRAYHKSKVSVPQSKAPLQAFSVFVDEECAAKNDREEQEQDAHADRQRQVRDERTFRERDSEGMVEKIFRDPVRYLRDPNRFKSEIIVDHKKSEDPKAEKEKEKAERKSRAGFSKRLLKDGKGMEQCFEEARANTGSYFDSKGSSMNFNKLQSTISLNQSSKMSLDSDRETSIDISMSESVSGFIQCSTDSTESFENKQFQGESGGMKLFRRLDESFGAGLNQTAISHASSTVNEIGVACGGTLGKKQEEETINTKFAMRELSMMFSSPALGADSARKRHDHSNASMIDEPVAHIGRADTSFGNVGDGILLDNSICNNGSEKMHDERRTFTERLLLKESKGGNDGGKSDGAGFAIFRDNPSIGESEFRDTSRPAGFQIYDEGNEDSSQMKSEGSSRKKTKSSFQFQIYDEGNVDKEQERINSKFESGDTASIADAIALLDEKREINDSNSSSSDEESQDIDGRRESEKIMQSGFQFQVQDEGSGGNDRKKSWNKLESGNTASISDAIAILDEKLGTDELNSSSADEGSQHIASPGDETATMSLFNEIFQDKLESREDNLSIVSAPNGRRTRRNPVR